MCNYLNCNYHCDDYIFIWINNDGENKKKCGFCCETWSVCNFTRAATVMKKKSGKLFVLGILRLFHFHVTSNLRHRRILTSVSNVCEEALMSLCWAPKDSTFFLSSCLANRHWHGAYSNLGTQVRPRTRISALFRRRTWPAVSFQRFTWRLQKAFFL